MGDREDKGYRAEIPDDALKEALQSVEKYDRPERDDSKQETGGADAEEVETVVQVEIEDQDSLGAGDERLKAELDAARQDAKQAHEKMLRVAADADNIRKRALKEREDAIRFGQEGLLRDLLPVIDNLQRSLEHVPQEADEPVLSALRTGVEMVLKQFLTILENHDVVTFESVGQPFDPKRHEAISRQETAETGPNVVLTEMHRGYLLHDRLLRPALVVVSCGPSDGGSDAKTCEDEPAAPQSDVDVEPQAPAKEEPDEDEASGEGKDNVGGNSAE